MVTEKYYRGYRARDKVYLFYLRYLSHHPGRRKLRRFLTNTFFHNGIEIRSAYQSRFRIKTFDFIDQEIIFKRHYEAGTLRLCSSLMKKGDIFVDVGANFGLYAINIAGLKHSQVVAIEPNPIIFNRLKEHIAINGYNNINVFNVAAGENFGIAGMSCPSVNNSGNYQVSIGQSEFYVAVAPLASIFGQLKMKSIRVLKIDVEGYEYYVLKGIDWNQVDIQNIIMEMIPDQMSSQNAKAESCLEYLKQKGYEALSIEGVPFDKNSKSLPESNIWLKKTH